MKNFVFIGGGHGDPSSNFVKQILSQHSKISPIKSGDSFLMENIANIAPYIAEESPFYLPRNSSMKYVDFLKYLADTFGVNAGIRQTMDHLESALVRKYIYIPRFGQFPLVEPLDKPSRQKVIAQLIREVFEAAVRNPFSEMGCERTPNNAQYINILYEYVPDAKVIIVDRDPLEVASNLIGADWGPGDPLETATYIQHYYERWFFVREEVPVTYYYNLRFDRLASDPETTLKDLFEYLHLPIEPYVFTFARQLIDDGKMSCCSLIEDNAARSILEEVRLQLQYTTA